MFRNFTRIPIVPKRNFLGFRTITDADLLRNIKSTKTRVLERESRYDSNVKHILPAIKDGDYNSVKRIVNEKSINIDSHDWWENTPLTDAAKRGDVRAVQFLIVEMGANVHASCDCPHHKTALHYASEYGHEDVVKLLLAHGADVNVLDSRDYTALDVAIGDSIKKLLISNGCLYGNKVPKNTSQRLNLPKADCPSLINK